jgi:predicted AlkP superfamily phosphohydrolase/phosphomutase
MKRQPINNKILILGMDAMDPRATKRYMDEGKMPNTKKLMEMGAAREDLEMLGGEPTGTPPMWTTLATGCWANVHGITCFNLPSDKGLEYVSYGFDSRRCKAEPLWNVFAESGIKTLVFNWPGSAWPPTSTSENLHVVDGTQPGGINQGIAQIEHDYFIYADKDETEITIRREGESKGVAPCAVNDMEVEEEDGEFVEGAALDKPDTKKIMLDNSEGTDGFVKGAVYDHAVSPIKPASGWADAPEDALEFVMLFCNGLVRRQALLVKNENGIYDTIKVYKHKKDTEPLVVLPKDVMVNDIFDISYKNDKKYDIIRSMRALEIAEDGSHVKIYVSAAMDINEKRMFYPSRLYQPLVENIGYPEDAPMLCAQVGEEIPKCMIALWDRYCTWQADALHFLTEQEGYQVIFSHNHVIDAEMHAIARNMKHRDYSRYSAEEAQDYMEQIYRLGDKYIGRFLHLVDEGWTIFLVSDHGLVCAEYERPNFGDVSGINVGLMRDLGFTVMKKDENGNDTHEVDWSKTKAVASRANNIYINLKGREPHGIVDPADKYQVEEEIMTALYGARHKISGQRIIACAMRNKDAVMLGYGGPECGDIVAWTAEGYNDDHFDAMATCYGVNYTSLMSIFVAAGPGIKKGAITDRIIRQIDIVPTVALIGGVRVPKQCEGAPIYQVLEEEF